MVLCKKCGHDVGSWQDISTAPLDGTPVELFMPKYQNSVRATYRQQFETLAAGWVHESGWMPELAEEYATKRLYSHWRPIREDAPEGYKHRKWNAEKKEFEYGK